MAFVFRSQKSSPFSITQSPSQLQIPDKDERIHHKCDHQYRKLLIQKKINHEHLKPTCSISPSISDGHRIYQPLKNDEKKKFLFNIRDVRKYKREYKLNQPQQNSKKDPEQFYDLPGSFSPKTMVKYVKSSPQKQNKIANPGPGTYNSQTQTSVQTPVFIKNSQSKILTRPSTNSDEEEAKNQNFFAVKYNCMTSSIFKKSPNLLKRSNKFLLNKIFHHQTPSLNNQIYQMIKDQYEQLNEKKPGPTAYHSRQPSLNQHACKFNQAQRFINSNTSEGPPKYYNLSPNKEQNFNKTSCFSSLVQRFEHKKQDLISLQYTDYEKPFIKQSKNVHKICFNSKIPRSEQMPIDNRPFYSVDNHKKDLLAKFCSNKCQRIPYYINIQPTPSPFSYNICSQWSTQNGFSIPKWQKTKVQNCCGAQNKGSLGISFYLCSQIQLNKKSNNQGSKSPKKRKELDKKAQKPKNKQKENDKYYDIPAEWQKKSFNRYFANDILPANNPIQFRI